MDEELNWREMDDAKLWNILQQRAGGIQAWV